MLDRHPLLQNSVKEVLGPAVGWWRKNQWRRRGCPIPAPHGVKQDVLRTYARDYGLRTLVETGTFRADTVRGLRRHFEKIISIELDPTLHALALRRCRRQKNALLLLGDSGKLIDGVVRDLETPALFWLDAHYSGGGTARNDVDTPILSELHSVLAARLGHVVLVDDQREFQGRAQDYPALSAVAELARRHGYVMTAALDIVRLVPQVLTQDISTAESPGQLRAHGAHNF